MSQETPMSVIDTCNEGAGEINSCAEPIPPKEIPSGNGSVVVSISNEGAGKVGSQAEPIRSGEDITQNEPELIADVFQDDILPRFMDAQSFKRFATAGNGLRLCRYDVQTIEDDHRHRSVENKKLEYLYKWREMFIGTDADAIKKIKELATTHLGSRNRSTGKFSYKREGTYSVGTIGMEDINCDFMDFTYVRVSSDSLARVVSKQVTIFAEELRKKRTEVSASTAAISGTITIEFYQKRRNRWPFPDESIPWEIWNLVITEKLLTSESERQVAQENIGSRLAEKIFCVTEAMNRHDFVPKMPTQSDIELVFETSFPDIQPYLFKITHRISTDSKPNNPVSTSVGSTVKRMLR